ncbi:MAG: DUF1330 domain-containing protein [Cyanobacteria bacterium P01_A01_bin.123]
MFIPKSEFVIITRRDSSIPKRHFLRVNPMSVLMIIEADIENIDRFIAYTEAVFKLVVHFGGRYRVLKGTKTTLEGDWGQTKIAISEWPSMEAAQTFWNSPEYAAVRKMRAGAAQVRIMLAETVSDDQWMQMLQADNVAE